jgi:hypothetical protein
MMTRMIIKTRSSIAAAALAISTLALAAPTHAAGVKAGTLTCDVDSGWGFIIASSRELKCTFSHGTAAPLEHYLGHIRKLGADIGYQSGGVIIWSVLAPSSNVGQGALAGDYAGAAGSAAVGVGGGVNVLLGGFQDSITLQPLSIEGMTGLNVAAGVAQMSLEFQRGS